MMHWIDSVKVHNQFPNVLEVKGVNGELRHYLEYQGTFTPGRIVQTTDPVLKVTAI